MAMVGRIAEEYRLPMCPMSDANRTALEASMAKVGLVR